MPVEEEQQPSIELESNQPDYLSLNEIKNMDAGTCVDDDLIDPASIDQLFNSSQISEEIKARIWNLSYKENNNISLDELRYLRILHWGFDGETHIGELIVNASIAEDVLDIMHELYLNDYLIERVVLIDNYDADDERSMQDNNSSAFNYRVISGTSKLSKHSLGLAIDINPLYNPYVVPKSDGSVSISPSGSEEYADRSQNFSYKLDQEDLCVKLFIEHGFTWGGNWNSVKDYQHFEK